MAQSQAEYDAEKTDLNPGLVNFRLESIAKSVEKIDSKLDKMDERYATKVELQKAVEERDGKLAIERRERKEHDLILEKQAESEHAFFRDEFRKKLWQSTILTLVVTFIVTALLTHFFEGLF